MAKKVKEAKTLKSVKELREDLKVAEKSFIEGTLHNPHALRSIKKDIARALTREHAEQVKANPEKGEK